MEGSDGTKWSALLGVAHAAKLDAGLFRCQVTYKGRQQCRTIRLHVLAPEVRLAPMSVTAYKVNYFMKNIYNSQNNERINSQLSNNFHIWTHLVF